MGHGDAVLRKEIDLLGVDGHAVDGHQAIAQETGTGERTGPGRARGRNEERGVGGERAGPVHQPVPFRGALGEVRRDRKLEPEAGGVQGGRRRVGSVRRDAEPDAVGERRLDALAVRLEAGCQVALVCPEHLEVDDAA